MLKTYQFKTHCKGDSHSSKTTNIILPGLMIIQRWTALRLQAKCSRLRLFNLGEMSCFNRNNAVQWIWIAFLPTKVEGNRIIHSWDMEILSQCSTLVRNTVVRAILQAYGKWSISTPWGAETSEPIDMKLGTDDYVGDPTPHAQNEKCTQRGFVWGWGEMFNQKVLFRLFLVSWTDLQLTR